MLLGKCVGMSAGGWSFGVRFGERVFHRYFLQLEQVSVFKRKLQKELVGFFTLICENALEDVNLTPDDVSLKFTYDDLDSVLCLVRVSVFERLPPFTRRHALAAAVEYCRWYVMNKRVPEVLGSEMPYHIYDELYTGVSVEKYEL